MQKVNLKILAAVCVFMMTLAVPAGAVTHYVSEGQSIQAAIDDANDYDEIEVAPGTYNEAINFLGKAVRLYSNGGPILTEIAGFYEHLHVVQCVSGEGPGTILEGFTITGGNATGTGGPDFNGGGMLNDGSSPTVTNCTFSGNWADYGGGMYNGYGSYPTVTDCIFQNNTAYVWGAGMFNNQSNPTVTNCTFLNNNASWDGGGMFNELSSPTVIDCNFINNIAAHSGGGMYSKNDSNSIVNNCTFSGNEARGYTANMGGGGMYNLDNSNPTVTNCMFSSNSAPWEGGGMRNSNSSPTVNNCMFSDNTATSGGGMHSYYYSSPTLTNCEFLGNEASWGGGMFNVDNCNPTLTNCTFSSNVATSASGQGGGIINNVSSSPTVTNCILWGNIPEQIVDYDSPSSTTTVSFSDVQGGWPAGVLVIDADPLFLDAAGGDLRLSSSASPCIDAGNNSAPSLPATDLAGNPRIVDGDRNGTAIVDMGAYEFQSRLIHNITQDCWYETIQAAINYSNGGDQIEVGPGRYYEAINFKGKSIRLYSSGGQDVTTIDGTGHYHVVQCVSGEGANTILEGFTITGGSANGSFPNNSGGGMYNNGSSPTVTNCEFLSNEADMDGGGMYNYQSSPTMTNCEFLGNEASWGGGMRNSYSSPTVTDCTFTNNSAFDGGGMDNSQSSPTVTNCTFSGNTAYYTNGGGMLNVDSSPTVTNCTFSYNSANGLGGGMSNYYSSPTVTNCILWGNTALSGSQIYEFYSSATVSYSDVQGSWGGTGNINADPCFIDAAAGDLRLQPDSPCIDAGDTTLLLTLPIPVDLDGNVRCFDVVAIPNTGSGPLEFLDMGAYEFQCSGLAGDNNCDGVVDFKDLAILAGNWLAGVGD